MSQLTTFRYFFRLEGVDYEIPTAPNGWEGTEIQWQRDTEYWANLREFSLPFKFTLTAAKYLRKILYTQGIDAKCTFVVKKLDPATESYFEEYVGEIDFSETVDGKTDVEVNVMETDLAAKVKALRSTEFEFDFNQPYQIRVPGVDVIDYVNSYIAGTLTRLDSTTPKYYLGTSIEDSSTVLDIFEAFPQDEGPFSESAITSDNYFLQATDNGILNITGSIRATFTQRNQSPAANYYNIWLMDSTVADGGNRVFLASTAFFTGFQLLKTATFDISVQANVVTGRNYFLVLERVGVIPSLYDPLFTVDEAFLKVTTTGTTTTSDVKAMTPLYLFEQIINRIYPGTPVASTLLGTSEIMITCGDAIRGLPNPRLKTSLDSFLQSMDAEYCIGFDSTGTTALLESREFFFRRTFQLADLGAVKDVEIQPYTDKVFSSIRLGYEDNSYEVQNGRFEFNSEQQWTTPVFRVQKSTDIKSAYRADQFGIEELRLKQESETENNTATDNTSDNDVFMIKVLPTPIAPNLYVPETASDYDSVEGIVSRTSSYNLALSPKNMLLKHLTFLRSSFFGVNENGFFRFASAKKNAELITEKDGFINVEKAPIYIRDYNDIYFLPFLVKFKTKYPRSLQTLVKNDPYGYLKFSYNGAQFAGYLMECKIDIARNAEQEFKLLLTPDNNLAFLF